MSEMKIGFEMRKIRVPLADILPVRQIKDPQKNIRRYQTIRDSIKEVGMVEPLVVHPQKDAAGKYFLLDGHLRLVALRELGETEADCIVANDDESFTYNARVNRLNPISEHKMIIKAVHNGVRPERICHQAEDHDAENPPQEDCLPIRATEALDQTERFLFEVDVNLLRGVMQQCLALLTWRQQEIFTMRYVDGLQPSDVARALGISPARVTQVLTESTAKIHAVFVKS